MKGFKKFLALVLILCMIPWVKVDAAANATYNVSGTNRYDYAYKVFELINQERTANGMPAVKMDADLNRAALQRAAECFILFSHTRPDGTDFYTISPKANGENVALFQMTPEQVMGDWMNSTGHKGNILDKDFKAVGIGCLEVNGEFCWVQNFGDMDVSGANPAQPANARASYQVQVDETLVAKNGGTYEFASKSATPATTVPSKNAGNGTAMHRLYNKKTGEHFYTASATERDNLVRGGWQYEDVAWNAPASGTPVYRLYNRNNGEHHYTTGVDEKNTLVRAGWKDEGIGWYSAPADSGIPMYRLFNRNAKTGAHHYTSSVAERDSLVRSGWKYEGIGWYGL